MARGEAPEGRNAARLRRAALLCAGLLASQLASCSRADAAPVRRYAPPLPEGGSVFFVGNSFLRWNGCSLPEWLQAVGDARGTAFAVGSDILPGDHPLAEFLGHAAVQEALASRAYRVWVIQGHEYEPVDHPDEFREAVRDFDAAVRAAGGRIVLFQTWEFRWREFLPELAAAYEAIGQELGAPIIPAGQVFRDCGRDPPGSRKAFFLTASPEHPEGDLHPNPLGMAASAYATYSILTGRNPEGAPLPSPGGAIERGLREYLSGKAWEGARSRLERRR